MFFIRRTDGQTDTRSTQSYSSEPHNRDMFEINEQTRVNTSKECI